MQILVIRRGEREEGMRRTNKKMCVSYLFLLFFFCVLMNLLPFDPSLCIFPLFLKKRKEKKKGR